MTLKSKYLKYNSGITYAIFELIFNELIKQGCIKFADAKAYYDDFSGSYPFLIIKPDLRIYTSNKNQSYTEISVNDIIGTYYKHSPTPNNEGYIKLEVIDTKGFREFKVGDITWVAITYIHADNTLYHTVHVENNRFGQNFPMEMFKVIEVVDNFVLPKKWCIKVDRNNSPSIVYKWRNSNWAKSGYISYDKWHNDTKIADQTEISLFEFERYVLGKVTITIPTFPEEWHIREYIIGEGGLEESTKDAYDSQFLKADKPNTIAIKDLVKGEVYYCSHKGQGKNVIYFTFDKITKPDPVSNNYWFDTRDEVLAGSVNSSGSFSNSDYYDDIRLLTPIEKDRFRYCVLTRKYISLDDFENLTFKKGDKVKLIQNTYRSNNKIGDVGIITEIYNDSYRVEVEGKHDTCNFSKAKDLELLAAAGYLKSAISNDGIVSNTLSYDSVGGARLGLFRPDRHVFIDPFYEYGNMSKYFPIIKELEFD